MQKIKVAIAILFSIIVFPDRAFSQDPVPLRQFSFNPYLFNPSFNAANGFTEVSLVHRRQWLNINDAPTLSGLNVQIPTSSKVSLGFNFLSQEVIGLRNSSLMATFGYAIPLAESQFLRFGLSGGIAMNDLNLKEGEYDPNDPTIISALENNYYTNGNFGVSYTNKGFSLGFSMPQLFKVPYTGGEFSTDEFSPMDYQLYSASYKIKPGMGSIGVEPYILYRKSTDMGVESFDVAAILSYKELLSLGGSYNTTQGPAFFLGANLRTFRFSYSFELPPPNSNIVNTSSHEIQVTARFGKRKGPTYAGKTQSTVPTSTPEPEPVVVQEEPAEETDEQARVAEAAPQQPSAADKLRAEQMVEQPGVQPTESVPAEQAPEVRTEPENETPSVEEKPRPTTPPRTFQLSAGHYVVAGVFRIMQNAIGVAQDLVRRGYFDATVAIHPDNNLYYVYVFSTYDLEEARKVRNQTRIKRPLNDAWVLTIGEP